MLAVLQPGLDSGRAHLLWVAPRSFQLLLLAIVLLLAILDFDRGEDIMRSSAFAWVI